MAQHDGVIDNGPGLAVRTDIQAALQALLTQNSGTTEPGTMYAGMAWFDTSTGKVKMRNAANSAWVDLGTMIGAVGVSNGGTGASTVIGATDALSTKGSNIASAGTTNIASATGRYVNITGTATITALGTATAGVLRILNLNGATLTHNATSLILPGGVNIVSTAGDKAIFVSEGSGNWSCVSYQSAAGVVPIITQWAPYTPTFTGFGTVSGVDCYWRRNGDTLELDCRFVCGTSTATQARMSLPSGLTSVTGPSDHIAGYGAINVASTGFWTIIIEQTQTYVTFGRQDGSNGGLTKMNGNTLLSSTNVLSFRAAVRIAGW